MLEIGLRTKVVACSISLLIGWWLVPSKVTISNETHRFLPGKFFSSEKSESLFESPRLRATVQKGLRAVNIQGPAG